ncbi:MAG: helix-turn-helix domain-containing protein [Janthinobacterium lividum]
MSQTVSLVLTSESLAALRQIVNDRRRPITHLLRARIVLLSDERLPVAEIARQAGISRPTVWRGRSESPRRAWKACYATRHGCPVSPRPRRRLCRPY